MNDYRERQRIIETEADIPLAARWVEGMVPHWLLGGPVRVSLGRPRRTLDQNSKLWPMLTDLAKQVEWLVDGEKQKLSKEEWKDIMTAALKKHQRVAAGVDGGFVILGAHTSTMDKRTFADLIELIMAFGAEHEVKWSEPAKKAIEEHRRAA